MPSQPNHWLMKTEPSVFSLDDLKRCPNQTTRWEGVRNYQARNFMQAMRLGDLALFYHSNCAEPGVVAVVEVVREAYPDDTAWDKRSKYFDEKASPTKPCWSMVDVKLKYELRAPVSLAQMRTAPELKDMLLLKKGQRLSVMPVARHEFDIICSMGKSQ